MRIRIDKPIYGGSGLGRIPDGDGPDAGKAIFVPLTLPGELVEAHAIDNRRSYINGAVDHVLEPSPSRTQPQCPYFPTCGGCQYQHADYDEQVAMKLAILRETMARAHVTVPDEIATLASPPWQYRNRIRLHVADAPEFVLCYREEGTHRNLPVDLCPVAAPLLQRAITATQSAARALGLAAPLFREIEFFTDAEERSLLLSLFASDAEAAKTELLRLCASLQTALPELRGAALFANEQAGGPARRVASWGEPSLLYTVADLAYHVSAGSFFQINRFLVPHLLDLVVARHSGRLAWDLYSGAGLFAQALARTFARVVAVESSPFSSADLRRNLTGKPHRIVSSDTLGFLQAETRRKPKPALDLIVLDPPRAGLGKSVCALLATIASPEIVYVSCDPATLARDLQLLQRSGYRIASMALIDLFPQTYHLETVVTLTRP